MIKRLKLLSKSEIDVIPLLSNKDKAIDDVMSRLDQFSFVSEDAKSAEPYVQSRKPAVKTNNLQKKRTVKKKKLKDDCIDSNILVRDCNSYPEQQNVEYRKKISSDLK